MAKKFPRFIKHNILCNNPALIKLYLETLSGKLAAERITLKKEDYMLSWKSIIPPVHESEK